MKIVPCQSYHEALCKLPNDVQASANEFCYKVLKSPELSSLNIEKLEVPDPTFRSARVNQDVRIILSMQPGDVAYLLYIDHHQEAYRWAQRKRGKRSSNDGQLILEAILDPETREKELLTEGGLFSAFSESKLKQLRLDDSSIFAAKRIRDIEDFEKNQSVFSRPVFEILSFLADGLPFDEVTKLAESMLSDAKAPASHEKQDVMIIESEESLQEYIDVVHSDIKTWRYFLHPMQRKLVEASYDGPIYVTGGAGTGKTVVAVHRVCMLAARWPKGSGKKVLLTTYTRNLATDLSAVVGSFCDKEIYANIEVKNVDKLIAGLLKEIGDRRQLIYGKQLEDMWECARKSIPSAGCLPVQFYMDEWERIVVPENIQSEESYKTVDRRGRGYPLSRAQRSTVWQVFRSFIDSMAAHKLIDAQSSAQMITEHYSRATGMRYEHIVVDELQDFSQPMLKMLRVLAGTQHVDDLFLVGDENQNIYGKVVDFNHTDIDVSNRKISLHINYRTTEQIRTWAVGRLTEAVVPEKALMFGQMPSVSVYATQQEENNHLVETLNGWSRHADNPASLCVIARTNHQINEVNCLLKAVGIETSEIQANQPLDDRSCIHLATMHRAKGLEFDYVYIFGVTCGVLPSTSLNTEADKAKRLERERGERQLLYVAASRARKVLAVSGIEPRSMYLT